MLKLLLINSPIFRNVSIDYDEDSLPPLGLGYIATNTRANGIETMLIDPIAENLCLDDLFEKIIKNKPSHVGLNIFTTNFLLTMELIEKISCFDDKIKVIIGGLATKTLYKYIFQWDVSCSINIVFGDGELFIPNLLLGHIKEKPKEIFGNKSFYSIDKSSRYFNKNISNLSLDRNFFTNNQILNHAGLYESHITTSRGCIYNCAFCSAAQTMTKELGIRVRSINSVQDEIEDIISKSPQVQSIRILDDLFLRNKNSIHNAIEIFGKYKIKWRAMAHISSFKAISDDLLNKLKESGCEELFIGIESGSNRILEKIRKGHNRKVTMKTISKILCAKISVKGYFIYGFPTEKVEDCNDTYELAKDLYNMAQKQKATFRPSVFQFRPYHGSELYYEIEGNIFDIEKNNYLNNCVGRNQFNFHSGNYSEVPDEILHQFIVNTQNILI